VLPTESYSVFNRAHNNLVQCLVNLKLLIEVF